MAIVAGVDFGTLSVRVSLVDSERGRLASAPPTIRSHRRREDPDHATQSHADHMSALVAPPRQALAEADVDGHDIEAIALDTTGSSVIPVGRGPRAARRLLPLVRSSRLARGRADHRGRPRAKASRPSTGAAASTRREWGFAKLLHWLRHNPEQARTVRHRPRALRHGRRPSSAASPTPRKSPAASAPWATSGCGIRVARWPAPATIPVRRRSAPRGRPRQDRRRATPPPTTSPGRSHRHGPQTLGLSPASRSPSAPSTPTGTPSAPAAA